MEARIVRVVEWIERELHRRIGVQDVAASAGLSVSRLTRLFRVHLGTTPAAYLHEQRMARARILIERTSLSIDDVMAQVGLSDPSHFARGFRRAHGCSPRELRQQVDTVDQRWRVRG